MVPIACSSIAAMAAVLAALLTGRQNRKIAETHKQVTVNGGKSDPPTVLDKIAAVGAKVDTLGALLHLHIADAAQDKDKLAEARRELGLE